MMPHGAGWVNRVARHGLYIAIAVAPIVDAMEGLPGEKVHELSEQRFADVHDSRRKTGRLPEPLFAVQIGDALHCLEPCVNRDFQRFPLSFNRTAVIFLEMAQMNTNKILHIFVYVVARKDDPFYGIRESLDQDPFTHDLREIRLSDYAYAQIGRVEYSRSKYFRLFFYRKVFLELKSRLDTVLLEDLHQKCFVYFADEGVWGEFVMHILRDRPQRNIVTVNSQHGLQCITGIPKSISIRKVVNWLAKKTVGYPWFGLGVGGSRFDIYLMYGKQERDFMRSVTTSLAYSCPRMIKASFIERYQHFLRNALDRTQDGGVRVLFAMEPVVPGAGFRCSESGFYYSLSKLFDKVFSVTGNKVIFRVHPGMNREVTLTLLRKTNLASRIEIDENEDVAKTLCDVDVVMSFHSTVLFEALLLGKVPVQVLNACADKPLHLIQESLKLDSDGNSDRISNTLCRQTIEKYMRYGEQSEDDLLDWSSFAKNIRIFRGGVVAP